MTGKALQIWCAKLTDFTALQTFKEWAAFKLINMDFAKEDARKLQETDLTIVTRTCTGTKLTFTGTGSNDTTELQTRSWLDFVETLKTRSDKNDLDEMCIWLGTNLPHKTPETIGGSSFEELARSLDDGLTLSD